MDLGDEGDKKTLEELKIELEPLMKDTLGDKVEEMIVSNRMVDSLRVLTTSEQGFSVNVKRIMKAQVPLDRLDGTLHAVASSATAANTSSNDHKWQGNQHDKREGKKGRERKKERKGEGERGQEVRKKEEERKAEKESEEEVKKNVTDWTVVSRSKKQKKMIQIYVKVNGGKVVPMEVNLTNDKVEDVMRRIQNVEDTYVTLHGRVLKRREKLKSCEVTDRCTIQVTSRLRGGGRSKNKMAGERKKKSPKKVEQNDRSTEEKNLPELDTIAEILEMGSRTGVGGWSAEMIEVMMGMDDEQMERYAEDVKKPRSRKRWAATQR